MLEHQLTQNYSRKLKQHRRLPKELVAIVEEVNQHGFYSVDIDEFMPNILDRDEQLYLILMIAQKAHLAVSFILEKNLCLFE